MGNREKTCSFCKQVKPYEDFHLMASSRTGRQSRCKPCVTARDIERQKTSPRKNTPERRDRCYRQTYGLTLAEVEGLFESQGGSCAICNKPARPTVQHELGLVVDHCHDTGVVRGLLCNECNRCLGLLRDDADILLDAAMYVLAHKNVLTTIGGESHG